jgi:hypothetical protein
VAGSFTAGNSPFRGTQGTPPQARGAVNFKRSEMADRLL